MGQQRSHPYGKVVLAARASSPTAVQGFEDMSADAGARRQGCYRPPGPSRVRTHVHVHACARVYAWARMYTACTIDVTVCFNRECSHLRLFAVIPNRPFRLNGIYL